MKNYKLILGALLLGTSVFFSCQDGLEDNLTENKVYLVSSGLQEFERQAGKKIILVHTKNLL